MLVQKQSAVKHQAPTSRLLTALRCVFTTAAWFEAADKLQVSHAGDICGDTSKVVSSTAMRKVYMALDRRRFPTD
jgi:hypothetical protein